MDLIEETQKLSAALAELRLPTGVSHAYDPLAYAWPAHRRWLDRFSVDISCPVNCNERVTVKRPYLILGMNPGPWGMVQTGVPFGDVPHARAILDSPDPEVLLRPASIHPKRPIYGFACKRVEDSGDRLWSGLAEIFRPSVPTSGCPAPHRKGHHELYANASGTYCRACGEKWFAGFDRKPALDAVLAQCFTMNYCPLAYFAADEKGTNVTPEEFSKSGPRRDLEYAAQLDVVCGRYLRRVMRAMGTKVVLAIGRYAEAKAKIAATLVDTDPPQPVKVVYLTHPSPLATRSAAEWAAMARCAMTAAGVLPGGVT